jgi:hypothetical protein
VNYFTAKPGEIRYALNKMGPEARRGKVEVGHGILSSLPPPCLDLSPRKEGVMEKSANQQVTARLANDPAFRKRYKEDAETALEEYGYRLSEGECALLSEEMIRAVVEGEAPQAPLVCPCSRRVWSSSAWGEGCLLQKEAVR